MIDNWDLIDYVSDVAMRERERFEDLEEIIHETVEQDWIADHLYDDMVIEHDTESLKREVN